MTRLDDLNDNCLLSVLDLLPHEELFKLNRVNRRLNQLAAEKMRTMIKTISYDFPDHLLSKCTHLGAISQDKLLVLVSTWGKLWAYDCITASGDFLLNMLPRFDGVKSINISCKQLSGDRLLEMFRLCPELECLNLGYSAVEEAEWDRVLELNGHKIVHFAKTCVYQSSEDWLLTIVAERCPNIRRVDWETGRDGDLTHELLLAFRMLPKSCWVILSCQGRLKRGIFEVIDELEAFELDWLLFGNRVDRLSSLNFTFPFNNYGPGVHGVEFAGLKTLDLNYCFPYYDDFLNYNCNYYCLIASRFSQLEEFSFDVAICFTEDDYEDLFGSMKSIKKLGIVWESSSSQVVPQLPASAIQQLMSLEIIYLNIHYSPSDWQPENFLQQLEQYVDEIKTLKKLTVVMKYNGFEWEKTVKEEVERMKEKQNRVEVELVCKDQPLS